MAPIPLSSDPVQEDYAKRQAEKQQALQDLQELADQQPLVSRHVFFVPGWAGEEGGTWTSPYPNLPKGHAPARAWIERIVPKPQRDELVHFVRFTLAESKASPSFLEFGQLLKDKIRDELSSGTPVDLVGHSMGSLDAIAAITQEPDPLLDIVNLLAVGSPLQGIFYGTLVKPIDELLPFLSWQPHQYMQVRNLDYLAPPMQLITSLETRQRLLDRIEAFHSFEGTQDMVVMRSARLRTDGLSPLEKNKISHDVIGGAMHTGPGGITQDPRTVAQIVQILTE